MVRLSRALPVPLILVGMIAVAGLALGRIYDGPLLPRLMLGAAAGSVGVTLAVRRLPPWVVAPLSVLALSGYAAWALWLAARHAGLPGALTEIAVDALRNGIPRLLTAMIPVDPRPDTVVAPVVVAWLAGLAGAELAIRFRRVLLGYAPPTVLFAGALYVVGPNARTALWPTLGYATLAAIGLAATARPRGSPHAQLSRADRTVLRLRTVAGTAAGVIAVVVLAALIGPPLAARVAADPVDPRRYVEPPQVDALDESPLIRISGWALDPDQRLFDADLTGTDDTVAIRLAVLSDYDGVIWRVGATYRTAGRVLPDANAGPDTVGKAAGTAAGPDVPGETVRQEITVAGLGGRLLPAVATPHRIDGARAAYDPGSGTLMRPEGLTTGLRYAVTSVRQRPEVNQLPAADVPSGAGVARLLQLGESVPADLERLARELSADNGAPYERALAIEQFLAEHYRFVADAPSGHAYPNLRFFLFGPRNAGGQRGTSEQFAASFAVLGRLMGLPTRVVVGFRAAPGASTVRGADAYAWPEVLFTGVGWVPFDPLPQPDTRPRPVEQDFRPAPERSTPPPSETPTPTAVPSAPAASPSLAVRSAPAGWVGNTALVAGGLGVLGLTGLAVSVPLLRRAQRRRRLTDGAPGRRVAGAWLEVTDALRLAGRPAAPHLAASEVAAHAAVTVESVGARRGPPLRLPAPPIDDLASLVNLAAFAPVAVDDGQARRAGTQALAYAAELRARRPWWARLLWSVHPGPLRWHR